MNRLTIRPTVEADLPAFAERMRQEDRNEIRRGSGLDPLVALMVANMVSTECWVAFVDKEPIAIWGLNNWGVITGRGSPWALTTDLVDKHWRGFARASRVELERMRQQCPNGLQVDVDVKYRAACRWLKWLGFELHGPKAHGPNGEPFYRATMGELANV